MTIIFSENPENDLWRELLQFTYEANIKRYLAKKGHEVDEDTINCIAGSFLQANEYYKALKKIIFKFHHYYYIMAQQIFFMEWLTF